MAERGTSPEEVAAGTVAAAGRGSTTGEKKAEEAARTVGREADTPEEATRELTSQED